MKAAQANFDTCPLSAYQREGFYHIAPRFSVHMAVDTKSNARVCVAHLGLVFFRIGDTDQDGRVGVSEGMEPRSAGFQVFRGLARGLVSLRCLRRRGVRGVLGIANQS